MKNDAVKNDRRIFKERIKAGEQMRKNHEKILERASEKLLSKPCTFLAIVQQQYVYFQKRSI